jgi:hypothetical protein
LESGAWIRLASIAQRYKGTFSVQFAHPLLVRCAVDYAGTGPSFRNEFIITPDGVLSLTTSSAASGTWGMTTPLNTFDGQTTLTTSTTGRIARTSFPSASSDQQNFIALNPSAVLENGGATSRSPCGDLSPVRVRTTDAQNRIFVYPRNSTDPSADTVRDSFVYTSPTSFSSALGRVSGNVYVGRTSAGGVGNSVDINGDGAPDATFSASCGFVLQLQNGVPTKVETDLNVTATISGRNYNLIAYAPVAVAPPSGNLPPTVSIVTNGTSFTAPATVTLTATASDSNGTVSKVDFYQGTTLLGTDTTSPYTFTKSSLAVGTYAFSAKATDNLGAVGSSNIVTVTVTNPTTLLPDVIVTALSYASGTFTCTVKNQGNAATPSGAQIGVEYQVDGVRRTWGLFAGPLAAGASVTIGTGGGAYVIPNGSHAILAWVDDLNRFAESNETNNKFSQTITVGPPTGNLGPVALWKLDATSGTIASDSSGNGFNGTLANYATSGWTTGKVGGALNFNGVSNIVTVGSPAALTNLAKYTITAWIKPRSLGEAQLARIVNKRSAAGWTLFLNTDGSAFFRQTFSVTEGAWSTPVNSVALGAWLHVAVAYDSSLATNRPAFYLNGKLVTTTVRTAPSGSRSSDAASPLSIGNASTLDRTFDGAIDDVRIYNRLLGASEIGGLATVAPTGTG